MAAGLTSDFNFFGVNPWANVVSHARAGRKCGLQRDASNWLIQSGQISLADSGLFYEEALAMAMRSAIIDDWLKAYLDQADCPVEIWSIGAGFDSRWQILQQSHYARRVHRYIEFDHRLLQQQKLSLLASSPYIDAYQKVVHCHCDLAHADQGFWPKATHPVVAIFEGVLEPLTAYQRSLLISCLQESAPELRLILDSRNHFALDQQKRVSKQHGVDSVCPITWAPERPIEFYENISGLSLRRKHEVQTDLFQQQKPWLRWLPLSEQVRESFLVLEFS